MNTITTNHLNTLPARPSNSPPQSRSNCGGTSSVDVFIPSDSRSDVDSGLDRFSKFQTVAACAGMVCVAACIPASIGLEVFGPIGAAVGGACGILIGSIAMISPVYAP